MILKSLVFRRAMVLASALALLGLGACGQKGNLCMHAPKDGTALPPNVPICKN